MGRFLIACPVDVDEQILWQFLDECLSLPLLAIDLDFVVEFGVDGCQQTVVFGVQDQSEEIHLCGLIGSLRVLHFAAVEEFFYVLVSFYFGWTVL